MKENNQILNFFNNIVSYLKMINTKQQENKKSSLNLVKENESTSKRKFSHPKSQPSTKS